MIKDENYIQISGWMLNELNLKGNELLIYALIHGFCQDGKSTYHGGLTYIAEWTNSTKQGVIKALKSLIDKKLIVKVPVKISTTVQYCEYFTVKSRGGKQSLPAEGSTEFTTIQDNSGKQSLTVGSTEFNGGGKQSLPNKNSEILRNSTSVEKNEIHEEKTEAEGLISRELKNLFEGHLVFDSEFVPEISRLVIQFELEEKRIPDYLRFVFERAIEKKPKSLTNMYYKMAKSAAIMQDFVLSLKKSKAEDEEIMTVCPICGSKTKKNGSCPKCNFDMTKRTDEKEISLQKQIFALSDNEREKFLAEFSAEMERQGSFGFGIAYKNPKLYRDFREKIAEIYRKYGITA